MRWVTPFDSGLLDDDETASAADTLFAHLEAEGDAVRDEWYGDKRDLVKWSVLLQLCVRSMAQAELYKLRTIDQNDRENHHDR